MSRTQNEGLARAPIFTPHRVKVVADDDLTKVVFAHGVDGRGFEGIQAQVMLDPGTTGCKVSAMFWSDLDGKYVPELPGNEFTIISSCSVYFFTGGRRFFLTINTVTGVTKRVDIDVAGSVGSFMEDFA